jgi:hypothetical protein
MDATPRLMGLAKVPAVMSFTLPEGITTHTTDASLPRLTERAPG